MTELEAELINVSELDDLVIDLNDNINIDLQNKNDNLNVNKEIKSTSFGPGIELLMNDKKKNNQDDENIFGKNRGIDLDDITKLENELNQHSNNSTTQSRNNILNNIFTNDKNQEIKIIKEDQDEDKLKVNFDDLGKATHQSSSSKKTWDGFSKFNNVPINHEEEKPKLSEEEILKEKFKILRKLDDLERKGVNLSKKYNMDSSLDEMNMR
jgi:hypothetical protein